MRRTPVTAALLSALALVALVAVATHRDGDASRPHPARAEIAASTSSDPTDPVAELPQVEAVATYVQAVEAQQVRDYLGATRAEVDAYLASIQPPPAPAPAPAPSSVVAQPVSPQVSSGACGGATNGADQFIQRESGGNPNAYNPSGAWGCYQIMPGTWAGAGCDELGSYGSASAAAQAQCASRLSLSAWAL